MGSIPAMSPISEIETSDFCRAGGVVDLDLSVSPTSSLSTSWLSTSPSLSSTDLLDSFTDDSAEMELTVLEVETDAEDNTEERDDEEEERY